MSITTRVKLMERDLTIFDMRISRMLATLTGFWPPACGPMVSNGEVRDYDLMKRIPLNFVVPYTLLEQQAASMMRAVPFTLKRPATDLDLRMSVDDTPVLITFRNLIRYLNQ